MLALFAGFGFSLSLILAIGAQNAFVLRQGLLGRHIFLVCLICALSDALLILVGVYAMASINAWLPNIAQIMRYAGVVFLLFYGFSRFYSAYRAYGDVGSFMSVNASEAKVLSVKRVIVTTLALTFLNPHVYIDTVLLLGTVANRYEPHQGIFALGAVSASFVFFFALGYGATLLRPIFSSRHSWVVLDTVIGLFMLYLAWQLLVFDPLR